MQAKYRWGQMIGALCLALSASIVQAKPVALQCIEAPQRTTPCPNLIYTSITIEEKSTVICLCKSDKQPLLILIADNESAKSRIALRKLLSQHHLTKIQLLSIGNN